MHHNKELTDTKTVFYGFAKLSEYRKFDSIKGALEAKSIYTFEETLGHWENLGYKNKKYVYRIFNERGQVVDRVIALYKGKPEDSWEMIGPYVEMDQYFQVERIRFQVKDPFGDARFLEFGSGYPGIANAMNYLDSARLHYSGRLHELELYQQIRRLKGISLEPLP